MIRLGWCCFTPVTFVIYEFVYELPKSLGFNSIQIPGFGILAIALVTFIVREAS